METDKIYCCDITKGIPLLDKSVHSVCTSPPYWDLRDYGVEGQLGLEKTPEEYIERMVGVFRHVWRVLRDDGTCWLNMGDSYASGGRGGQGEKQQSNQGALVGARTPPPGLKPKDLCMMPARLAIALQQPFYTGKIKNELDRVWLAAMIEAEGCIFIHKRKAGDNSYSTYTKQDGTVSEYNRTQDTYGSGLEVASTDRVIVEKCMQIAGIGSICQQSPEQNKRRKQTIYRWNVRSNECRWIISELYPHFVAKQLEARLAIGCPSSGEKAAKAHESLKSVHQGGKATIDFPAPKPLFEQGWYLRNDIIWAKCNPMPESVTDRCTKSHEHIFLLTKKPKYFYDADAIREDVTGTAHDRGTGINPKAVIGTGVGYNRSSEADPTDKRNDRPRVKQNESFAAAVNQLVSSRNKRDVWTIPTQSFPEAHFATFPEKLVEPCIKAGTSEKGCCPECGSPWVRMVEKDRQPTRAGLSQKTEDYNYDTQRHCTTSTTIGWKPTCKHGSKASIPCTVYDPFMGSGTVGLVAYKLNRHYVGTELNAEYIKMAEKRIGKEKEKFSLLEG
jgi:DNA modification methylase